MKLAMIGSYGHCGDVLGGAAKLPDVELVAAARWGGGDPLGYVGSHPAAPADLLVYDDYRKMLDEVKPDVVGVFMPLYRNAEASIAAAQHGAHVISEKPLATELDDLAALRRAVGEAGVRIASLQTMRGFSPFLAVRNVVRSGRIGEPVLAAAQKSYIFGKRDEFYRKRETYGGTIPWVAIHALDYVSYCTAQGYTRVAAMHSNVAHPDCPGTEDNGGILLELSGGGHAVIRFDYLRPGVAGARRRHGDDRLRIAGTEGIVEVVEEGTGVRLMTPTDVEDVPLPPARDLFATFLSSIRGTGDCLISPDESFRLTEVALKARHAADTGKVLEL